MMTAKFVRVNFKLSLVTSSNNICTNSTVIKPNEDMKNRIYWERGIGGVPPVAIGGGDGRGKVEKREE